MSRKPKDKPLRVFMKNDVLTIEIGVATLAFADEARREYTRRPSDPSKHGIITDANGFARDVHRALTSEREDGSTLLTDMLDAATEAAIDDGSEFYAEVTTSRSES